MKKFFIFILLVFSFQLSYADKLKVISSFSILGNWLKEIGGNKIEVVNLVDLNHDSHHYETTAQDQIALKEADIIFIHGLHFESGSILNAVKAYSEKLIIVSNIFTSQDLIPLIQYHFSDEDVHEISDKEVKLFDPHTWHDIRLAKKSIRLIQSQLIKKNPSNWKYFSRRANEYLKKLDELQQWSDSKFKQVDIENSVLITVHAGFKYLANYYHLDYLSLESEHEHEHGEISAKKVSETINSINKKNVKYIFSEKNSDVRIAQLVSKRTGTGIVGDLYSDFLSDKNEEVPNYLELMRHNIDKITLHLKRK
ncbi:MAG: hypothetical protein GKC53_01380 [Neisseriaceae bacterium]|nr:MAG: hypothetical protein GKC53_01380 [Neisseriaceae bacterium]